MKRRNHRGSECGEMYVFCLFHAIFLLKLCAIDKKITNFAQQPAWWTAFPLRWREQKT